METNTTMLWTGRVLTGLAAAFLLFDGAIKFTHHPAGADATAQLGWPLAVMPAIGVVLLTCLALYVFPPTAVLGAILLTGYLGGAVATHVRVGNPLFTHTLFPIYVGAVIWGGLWMRDPRVRALVPLRRN
jgi:hypothetical protein